MELQPITISVTKAAELTGLSEWTIRDLIYKGVIDTRRHGRRVLVLYSSLKSYVESLEPQHERSQQEGRVKSARATPLADVGSGNVTDAYTCDPSQLGHASKAATDPYVRHLAPNDVVGVMRAEPG